MEVEEGHLLIENFVNMFFCNIFIGIVAQSSSLDDPLLIKFSGWYIPGLDFIYIYIIQVQIFVFSL
jgi:hypothetical protein